MPLDRYDLLGRSGLRTSRLSLGTMSFGTDGEWCAWGSTEETSRAIEHEFVPLARRLARAPVSDTQAEVYRGSPPPRATPCRPP